MAIFGTGDQKSTKADSNRLANEYRDQAANFRLNTLTGDSSVSKEDAEAIAKGLDKAADDIDSSAKHK